MNWSEILKGKKQFVAIMTLIMLAQIKAEPIYLAVTGCLAVIVQGVLDIVKIIYDYVKEKKHETKNDLISIDNGDVVAGRID